MKELKLRKILTGVIILVAILSSIGGIIGLSSTIYINSSYRNALQDYGFARGDIGLFSTEFNNSNILIRDLIFETDSQKIQSYCDELDKSNTKINTYLENIKKAMVTEKELQYYNDIKNNTAKYETISDQVIVLSKQNKGTQAHTLMLDQAVPVAQKIRTATEALMYQKTTIGNQLSATLASQGTMALLGILIAILISFILSLTIARKISIGISTPIIEMADVAKKMAEGDLSVQTSVSSKDNEIGQLGAAFSETIVSLKNYINDITVSLAKMAQGDLRIAYSVDYKGDFIELQKAIHSIDFSLNDALSQINLASEQVLTGSQQVSNSAQTLAQGATEQASSIEELSATITEISSHVKENAEHATAASVNVNDARSGIEISNRNMSEMVAAMSQINDSSSKIGKIIKTIEDIAFQTNILALNAAVEAARAGAAGKGFAVVADEVRNLASTSAEAAKNTTALIENSMSQVEKGTIIADKTAKSLLQVVESVKAVSNTVDQISQASIQQSNAIGQVTLGINQISSVVQTNSATAEESAAASEELSGQAQMLKGLVKKFKLRDQASLSSDSGDGLQNCEM